MALQTTITLPSTLVVTDAYSVISGFCMSGKLGIVVTVNFYVSSVAYLSGAPHVTTRDYILGNPVPIALINSVLNDGTVDVLAVMYSSLLRVIADFNGATSV